MKISRLFFSIARVAGKIGSTLLDVETILSRDPKKIAKRMYNKKVYKTGNKISRKFRWK